MKKNYLIKMPEMSFFVEKNLYVPALIAACRNICVRIKTIYSKWNLFVEKSLEFLLRSISPNRPDLDHYWMKTKLEFPP